MLTKLTIEDVARHKADLWKKVNSLTMPDLLRRFIHTFSEPAQEQKLIFQFDCKGGDK